MSSTQNRLSVTRAADREKMVAVLSELAMGCGAQVEREDLDRQVVVRVTTEPGLNVNIFLDGESTQPDTHVLSWHMRGRSELLIDQAAFGGRVNSYHHQKATYVAEGFGDLCDQLKKGLDLIQSGQAFQKREVQAASSRPRM